VHRVSNVPVVSALHQRRVILLEHGLDSLETLVSVVRNRTNRRERQAEVRERTGQDRQKSGLEHVIDL